MWLTQEDGLYYKHSFDTSKTLHEGKTSKYKVGVYETNVLGRTLVVDGKIEISELDEFAKAEMAVHVPMCSHKEPSDVALIDTKASLACEMLQYKNINCTWTEEDSELINIQKEYFDVYDKAFSTIKQENKNSLDYVRDADEESLDVVISGSKVDNNFSAFTAHVARILRKDGLAVFEVDGTMMDTSALKETILEIGKNFKIVMPYRVEAVSVVGGVKTFILASKEYHPTADLILQRADLIDGLKFYNSDIHPASFAMPNYIRNALRGIAKN